MRVAFVLLVLGVVLVIGLAAFVVKRRARHPSGKTFALRLRRSDKPKYQSDRTSGIWGVSGEMSDPKRVHAYLEIDYKDGNGSWTKRLVQVKEFDNNIDGGILIGHCELRRGTRTFRFERIMQCVDLETGEAVENVQTYLNDIYSKPAESSMALKNESV